MMDSSGLFTGKSDVYGKGRPGYGVEFFEYLEREIGIGGGSVIADVGAGTGKLSKGLLERGAQVYCVEPNRDMRRGAEALLQGYEGFVSVDGNAEYTRLEDDSVDLVVAAQAFHWFDGERFRRECVRILRGKYVILLYNLRIMENDLMKENAEILVKYCPRFKGFSGGMVKDDGKIREFYRGQYQKVQVRNDLVFTREKFMQRACSASYSLTAKDSYYQEYMGALNGLFDKYSQARRLTMPNEMVWYVGKM